MELKSLGDFKRASNLEQILKIMTLLYFNIRLLLPLNSNSIS